MPNCRFPGVSRTKKKKRKKKTGSKASLIRFSSVIFLGSLRVGTWRYFATFLRVAKSENTSLQNLSRIFYTHAVRVTLPRKIKFEIQTVWQLKKKTIRTHARRTFFFFCSHEIPLGRLFSSCLRCFFFFPVVGRYSRIRLSSTRITRTILFKRFSPSVRTSY